jgi:hypothetical protein
MTLKPSTTRSLLDANTRALLFVACLVTAFGGFAAFKCPDPTPVLVAGMWALAFIAVAVGAPTAAGAVARKKWPGLPFTETPPATTPDPATADQP